MPLYYYMDPKTRKPESNESVFRPLNDAALEPIASLPMHIK
jgi:hypothetical protein